MLVDEHRRAQFEREKAKGFDFLLYSDDDRVIIAEVKGRKFKGKSLENLSGMECWVTAADVDGLAIWQDAFGCGHAAAFVFAYEIENYDADLDGREAFEFNGCRYVFFAVSLDDYRKHMKLRSPRWKTVTLPAAKFRRYAVPVASLLADSDSL